MKNISTQVNPSTVSQKETKGVKPGNLTLDFLRQFARVYRPTNAVMPGFVLN
ncbi:MAG: hypothetical protein K2J66_10315 [Muribaculaceae bacterium]|nr:hypothetical protein [Muribaculaceae bacterium]MDE6757513.1 hypothetical protein [Muribaculaceae bacterium]